MRTLTKTVAALGLGLALPLSAFAGNVEINPDLDNTIFGPDMSGTLANGDGPVVVFGRNAGLVTPRNRRGLMRFDLSAIPPGSTINSADLRVHVRMTIAGPEPVDIHRVTQAWGEGGSYNTNGAPGFATAGDATWTDAIKGSTTWASAGGDFIAAPSATGSIGAFGFHTVASTPGLVADVQGWLDGTFGNHGWILIGNESASTTAKLIDGRTAFDPATYPALIVDYTPPISSYCTAGTTTNGCNATLSGTGIPSASAASGFDINVSNVEGNKNGLLFYGINGPNALTWGMGGMASSSFLCVKSPTQRTPAGTTTGTSGLCDGTYTLDFNAYLTSNPTALGQPFAGGETVNAQFWFRDPPSPNTTHLSNGLEFVLCP